MRRKDDAQVASEVTISIHASVKDATGDIGSVVGDYKISIHASVKDATSG